MGEELIVEGKQKLASALTYDEVDAIEAEYISKLGELKTKAEWEQEVPPTSESDSTKEDPKSGWIFAVIGAVVLLAGAATTVALIINKNKKNKKENKGAQNEE